MVLTANVTRRALTLGSADSITGWYDKSYSETTLDIIIRPKGSTLMMLGMGLYAKHDITGFTSDGILEGDEIRDSNGVYYTVEQVEEEWILDSFSHYVCALTKEPLHADRPATYGTGATVEDPRSRTKVFLDTYLDPTDITEDDNVSLAHYIVCFADPDYPISKIFLTQGIDLVITCGQPNSDALRGYDHSIYGYTEHVPITVHTIDKATITGTNLMWKAEHEIRDAFEDHWLGSLRVLGDMKPKTRNLGGKMLYSQEYMMEYTRDLT